jgi:hypothetical protein
MSLQGNRSLNSKNAWLKLVASGIVCLVVGCNSNQRPTAPVSGTVIYKGQPVSGGTIVFMPKERSKSDAFPGKAARGVLDSSGRFKLSTYGSFDGAIVGKHTVTYLAGESGRDQDASDEQEEGKEKVTKASSEAKSNIGLSEGFEIEVKPKTNVFEIELGNLGP